MLILVLKAGHPGVPSYICLFVWAMVGWVTSPFFSFVFLLVCYAHVFLCICISMYMYVLNSVVLS